MWLDTSCGSRVDVCERCKRWAKVLVSFVFVRVATKSKSAEVMVTSKGEAAPTATYGTKCAELVSGQERGRQRESEPRREGERGSLHEAVREGKRGGAWEE